MFNICCIYTEHRIQGDFLALLWISVRAVCSDHFIPQRALDCLRFSRALLPLVKRSSVHGTGRSSRLVSGECSSVK
jgi:hypothetical protein